MARYDHLQLKRVGEPLARRKVPARGGKKRGQRAAHGKKIKAETEEVIRAFRASTAKDAIDPHLIFKLRLDASIADDEWRKAGLKLLAYQEDSVVILFSDDSELQMFNDRIDKYSAGPPKGQKEEPYAPFIDAISSLEPLHPADRIGPSLRAEGINEPEHFNDDDVYLVDVEIWHLVDESSELTVDRIINHIEPLGAEELSRYTPQAGLLVRVRGPGAAIKALLSRSEIALIDFPPQPDIESGGIPDFAIDDIGEIGRPEPGAVRIGVIDSGVTSQHPLLAQVVVGEFGLDGHPIGDENGHGTGVAAIAAYGDIGAMLEAGAFAPKFEIASARVVDARGKFSDISLAPALIEAAIRRLHDEFGCRVINLSLADPRTQVGRRGTIWSVMLDTLARELDVIIVAAAGNTSATALTEAHGNRVAEVYPNYLVEPANRILDPAGSLNAVTVGSVAHVNGLAAEDGIFIQKIADFEELSPFTRRGPGLRGAIKPDLVDFGGTAIFDGMSQRLRFGRTKPSTGILSLHNIYVDRLFSSFSGTSFAAPLVAYKAAYLLERFPGKSANFVRTLLAISADHPDPSQKQLAEVSVSDRFNLLGYGRSDLEAALFSDDDRVVLTAEEVLEPDKFAVFELPITGEFQTEEGLRFIRIALAYDPPVRRSRKDYAGMSMQFDLIRGSDLETVFGAYRSLAKVEEKPDKLPPKQRIDFVPAIEMRKPGTLQCATFTRRKDMSEYGDTYYLVVRCIGGWAADDVEGLPYTVAVMLRHEAQIKLYERMRVRLGVDE